jgi:hypothetical protein
MTSAIENDDWVSDAERQMEDALGSASVHAPARTPLCRSGAKGQGRWGSWKWVGVTRAFLPAGKRGVRGQGVGVR